MSGGLEIATPSGVMIRLLGPFEIIKEGMALPLRVGGKTEHVLSALAAHPHAGVTREALVEQVWPDTPLPQSIRCLSSLLHWLKRQLHDALGGEAPVIHSHNRYRLNIESGLSIDVLEFETAVDAAHRFHSAGSVAAAIDSYRRAVSLYRGDLTAPEDITGLLHRERLRALCLDSLARLGDAHFGLGDYPQALAAALQLIAIDACREDAHRMTMRAYVRLGARAQALRQYALCRAALAREFDAEPEPATVQLYAAIRTDPSSV
ncbi:BTAD domain-containing putative transcriptional regulator [Mycobacterium sp. AMU20-3851]|uniref:AfsR/SARP family transcriptional regulator n=1 Tax=Mycobacterium sp. AMU20-3851 TaxID=3122055 RepID=UPI0037546CB8